MAQVWECEFDKLYHQMVLLAMADHANDLGESVYPSVARLAWKVGCSERHVQRAMTYLRDKGILIKVAEPRFHRPTEYRIDMSRASRKPAFTPQGVTPMSPIDKTGVTPMSQRGDTDVARGVTPMSQEPSLNHQEAPASNAFSVWLDSHNGKMTQLMKDSIVDLIEDYSDEWVMTAIQEASKSVPDGKFALRYVERVLERWKKEGFQSERYAEPEGKDVTWLNT